MRRPGIPITGYNAPSAYGLQFVYFYRNGNKKPGVLIKDVLQDAGLIANGHELVLGYYQSVHLKIALLDHKVDAPPLTISCVNLTKAELALTVCQQIIQPLHRRAAEPVAKGKNERRLAPGRVQIDDVKLVSVVDLGDGHVQAKLEVLR